MRVASSRFEIMCNVFFILVLFSCLEKGTKKAESSLQEDVCPRPYSSRNIIILLEDKIPYSSLAEEMFVPTVSSY